MTFQALYSAVVDTLWQISQAPRQQWNADTASKASSLLKSAVDFGFITTFVIVSEVMSYVHSLTIALQESSLNIICVYETVSDVNAQLKKARMAVDGTHANWWDKAVAMASMVGNFVVAIKLANRGIDVCCLFKVDTEPSMPRVCARQTHRDNAVAVSSSDYFKKAVTVPMLDELCGRLDAKFEKHQQIVVKG